MCAATARDYNTRMIDTRSPMPDMPTDDWRIDAARVLTQSAGSLASAALEIVEETGSTNSDLMQRLKAMPRDAAPARIAAVRVAYRQSAGRGRQGRAWHAAPGHALTFSVATLLPRPLAGIGGLSLAVGVALVDALRSLVHARAAATHTAPDAASIALKWPNDVLLARPDAVGARQIGKLAGVLIETAWSTGDRTAAVIGIGINVREDAELASRFAAPAAGATGAPGPAPTLPLALSALLPEANLSDTLAAVLVVLSRTLERFATDGFAPFRERWNACHAYAGETVALYENGVESLRGTALGVDEIGQLLVSTDEGVRTVATGDVSLRPAPTAP
jgi:BirA family biotin operon repressor/biotin-[acetyl-CoA-carboxylase] ligase